MDSPMKQEVVFLIMNNGGAWSLGLVQRQRMMFRRDTLGLTAATTDEVKNLRRESTALKEVVAEQALELRLLKKSMIADGGDGE